MTILDAINIVDKLKPNQYDTETKVMWLDLLDRRIFRELILTHLMEVPEFDGYDGETDLENTELLAPDEYRDVYRWWLEMQIDLSNSELAKYNNDTVLFNSTYHELASAINRAFMPKSPTIINNITFIRRTPHVLSEP